MQGKPTLEVGRQAKETEESAPGSFSGEGPTVTGTRTWGADEKNAAATAGISAEAFHSLANLVISAEFLLLIASVFPGWHPALLAAAAMYRARPGATGSVSVNPFAGLEGVDVKAITVNNWMEHVRLLALCQSRTWLAGMS